MFTSAIVRPPGPNYAQGLTSGVHGPPVYEHALEQHQRYCAALEQAGLKLIHLAVDHQHPDSTFVEDTAVLTADWAILTRPGAPSRQGEVDQIKAALLPLYDSIQTITAPGTVEGGDICQVEDHFFIGLSERTNQAGAEQLARLLEQQGCTASLIDIRPIPGLLHLKTGLTYLGDQRLVLIEALADHQAFQGYKQIRAAPGEEYAANCLRINDFVLLAAGYPALESSIKALGYPTIALEVSEFQKMDGSLSCLSLRM